MKTRKLTALILSILMILSMLPTTIFAAPSAVTTFDSANEVIAHDHGDEATAELSAIVDSSLLNQVYMTFDNGFYINYDVYTTCATCKSNVYVKNDTAHSIYISSIKTDFTTPGSAKFTFIFTFYDCNNTEYTSTEKTQTVDFNCAEEESTVLSSKVNNKQVFAAVRRKATSHTGGNPTCVASGNCTRCGTAYMGGHSYSSSWTQANVDGTLVHRKMCTNSGCTSYTGEGACSASSAGICTSSVLCDTCSGVVLASGSHSYSSSWTQANVGGTLVHRKMCTNSGCTSYTGEETCSASSAATCTSGASCGTCYGAVLSADPSNHSGSINDATGIYTCCGAGAEPSALNGIYQISTIGHLIWFRDYVNAGNADAMAVLADNIDMSGVDWTPIGNDGNKFAGTFDGQGFSITGLTMNITDSGDWGLFGFVSNATIKNFSISGEVESMLTESPDKFNYGVIGQASGNTIVTDIRSSVNFTAKDSFFKNTVGGIVGKNDASGSDFSIERCSFSGKLDLGSSEVDCTGGIIAYVMAKNTISIKDCLFDGEIVSGYSGNLQIGGMMGYYRGALLTIKNCLSVGTITNDGSTKTGMIVGVLRQHGSANSYVTNNYYTGTQPFGNSDSTDEITDGYGSQTAAKSAEAVEDEQLKSGEVAYKLGSAWGQTETDDYPILGGETVYKVTVCGETAYSNTNENIEHNWENGICLNNCGKIHEHGTDDWNGDTCSVCGLVCEHSFTGGSCSICGILNEYEITFNAGDGTCDTALLTTAGGKLESIPDASKQGFEFLGWFDAEEDGNIISSETVFTENTTVYAQYQLDSEIDIYFSTECTVSATHKEVLTSLLPADVIVSNFSLTFDDICSSLSVNHPSGATGDVYITFGTREHSEPASGSMKVVLHTNYGDIAVNINVTLTGKYIVNISALREDKLYDGNPHTGFNSLVGTLTSGALYDGEYTFTYYDADGEPLASAPTEVGLYSVSIGIADDNEDYKATAKTLGFDIVSEAQALYQKEEDGDWVGGAFTEAASNVYDGGTIKLVKDVYLSETVYLTKAVTVTSNDITNKNIITSNISEHGYLINVTAQDVKFENVIIDGGNQNEITAIRGLIIVAGKLTIGEGVYLQNNTNTTSNGAGGAIVVNGGEVVMNGGVITNCSANWGGAIYLVNEAKLTVDGGEFTNNSAVSYGGAIYIVNSLVTVNSGKLTGNSAPYGGTITVASGDLVVTGGEISGNEASRYAAGIDARPKVNVTISGNAIISGNTSSEETDGGVYINCNPDDRPNVYVGQLTDGADVSFYSWMGTDGFLVANPAQDYTITENDMEKLSYNGDFVMEIDESGNIILSEISTIVFDIGQRSAETNIRYAEIDGAVTEVEENNDTYSVEIGEENLLIEIVEKTADGEFVKSQYFYVDMTEETASKLSMDSYMQSYDKKSIRIKDPMGMRFMAHILVPAKYEETEFVIDEYGYIIATKAYLDGAELTLDTERKAVGVGYNKADGTNIVFEVDDTQHVFTGVLMNIPVAEYKTDLVCKTYTKITVSGKQFVVYGEAIEGNVYDTANKLLETNPGDEDLLKIILDYENTIGLPGDNLYPEE